MGLDITPQTRTSSENAAWMPYLPGTPYCSSRSPCTKPLTLGLRRGAAIAPPISGGQVSLNLMPHIRREPLGMLWIPLLSFALWG